MSGVATSDAILSITEQGEAVHGVQVWRDAAQAKLPRTSSSCVTSPGRGK
jgi:hypothetical protein